MSTLQRKISASTRDATPGNKLVIYLKDWGSFLKWYCVNSLRNWFSALVVFPTTILFFALLLLSFVDIFMDKGIPSFIPVFVFEWAASWWKRYLLLAPVVIFGLALFSYLKKFSEIKSFGRLICVCLLVGILIFDIRYVLHFYLRAQISQFLSKASEYDVSWSDITSVDLDNFLFSTKNSATIVFNDGPVISVSRLTMTGRPFSNGFPNLSYIEK